MTVSGIDLSNWQGDRVDWDAVAASGVQFALIKASEGTAFADPDFARNWAAAKRVGLVRGAYQFGQPDQNTPEADAAYFLARVGVAGGLALGDLVVLDLEAGSGDLRAWTIAWLAAVEAAAGFKPLLYTGAWFAGPHDLEGDATISQYGLWLAAYQATMPDPLPGWGFIAIWQNSDTATVPGVPGNCDIDVFNGDSLDQLRRYGAPASPPLADDKDAQIAQLTQQLATLTTQLAGVTADRDQGEVRIAAAMVALSA